MGTVLLCGVFGMGERGFVETGDLGIPVSPGRFPPASREESHERAGFS